MLNSGASVTICGQKWFDNYVECLSSSDLGKVATIDENENVSHMPIEDCTVANSKEHMPTEDCNVTNSKERSDDTDS